MNRPGEKDCESLRREYYLKSYFCNTAGLHGNSYALPTKDHALRPMPLEQIAHYVRQFFEFAAAHPELAFQVTRVGCGLAGYSDQQMAPLFGGAPKNCQLPPEWRPFLPAGTGAEKGSIS